MVMNVEVACDQLTKIRLPKGCLRGKSTGVASVLPCVYIIKSEFRGRGAEASCWGVYVEVHGVENVFIETRKDRVSRAKSQGNKSGHFWPCRVSCKGLRAVEPQKTAFAGRGVL